MERKKILCSVILSLSLLVAFLYSDTLFAEDSPKPQVASEKSVTGLIKSIEAIPPAKTSQTSSSAKLDAPLIRTDVEEYLLSLHNLSDRYKIVLKPATAVKAGNINILPDQLRPGMIITANYTEAGEKIEVKSLKLEKILTPKGVMFWSMSIGLVATLILFFLLSGLFKKTVGISGLIVGHDKRYSNSKFQMVIWTFFVIFSYVTLYLQRFFAGSAVLSYSSAISIPENLGILLGISAGSFLGAKAITSSKVAAGSISKVPATDKPSSLDLITNDYKAIDLGDAQMFAWTLVASGIYLVNFFRMCLYLDPSVEVSLPNVDSTLLVLMGVSQAAYAGKKLVTSDVKPAISKIDPAAGAKVNDTITLSGSALGNLKGEVFLGSDSIKIEAWYETTILAKIVPINPEVNIQAGKTVLCVKTAFGQTVTCPYAIL